MKQFKKLLVVLIFLSSSLISLGQECTNLFISIADDLDHPFIVLLPGTGQNSGYTINQSIEVKKFESLPINIVGDCEKLNSSSPTKIRVNLVARIPNLVGKKNRLECRECYTEKNISVIAAKDFYGIYRLRLGEKDLGLE